MKYTKTIIAKYTIKVIVIFLFTTLLLNAGCNTSNANIRLHGISLGTVAMDGKPVEGLPSEKIDLLLEISVKEITVDYNTDSTTLTLSPSGATVEITTSGIIINGINPEQMKVEWIKQDILKYTVDEEE